MSVSSAAPTQDVSTLRVIDFDVDREDWSRYELEDGNKVRARLILVGLRGPRVPPQRGDPIVPESTLTVKVDAPLNRRGPKGIPTTPEEIADPKKHGGVAVNVVNSSEPQNVYSIKGTAGKIRIKLVLNQIWRIDDRYDHLGDPVYVVNFSAVPYVEA